MYHIEFDEKARFLMITQSGFWNMDEAQRFHKDLLSALDAIDIRDGVFCTLADSRDFAVQSAEVSVALDEVAKLAIDRPRPRQIAIVTSNLLSKRQLQRIGTMHNMRVFTDMAEGRQWLIDGL